MTRRLLPLLLAAVLTCAGCWDLVAVDQLAIVGSIGLDEVTPGKILVSLEIINPQALATGTALAATPAPISAWVLREEADSIPAALANIQRRTPRSLFVGQANTVIFGQELAREGVRDHLDYLAREFFLRRSVFVNTCDTSAGLLQRPFMLLLPSLTLGGLALHAPASGMTSPTTLNEFLRKLAEPGIEPVTTHTAGRKTHDVVVKLPGEEAKQDKPAIQREQPLESERNIPGELPDEHPALDPLVQGAQGEPLPGMTFLVGIAAYRGDRLVGFLDGPDARGYLWAVGQLQEAVLQVPAPGGTPGIVSLDVTDATVALRCVQSGGGLPRISLKLRANLQLSSAPGGLATQNLQRELEQAAANLISAEVRRVLQLVQGELKTDIYGFGNLIYRKRPKVWQRYSADWNERWFPQLQVDVSVTATLANSGAVVRHPRR
ncbi:MAG: Ger(x)C family spore germination protein [Bacillota bacterium]